jgi:DNA primase
MQVRLLGRFSKRVMLNFDPDAAGAGAMEKSIALLTEEDFDISVLQLEDGLDPDRFVRERGVQAYLKAVQGRQRYSDYLIERARLQFPGRTAEAKVNAMNFLLPHIRRMPNRIQRDEFAADAAQKLGIDSALMRQELKQAAAKRLGSLRSHGAEPVSEVERVLLRALVQPESDGARALAANRLAENPDWYEGLAAATLFDALAHGVVPENPLDAAPDEASTALLAEVLHTAHDTALTEEQVEGALETLERKRMERRQRELRTGIAEAERRGDQAMVERLMLEKMSVDRALRLH